MIRIFPKIFHERTIKWFSFYLSIFHACQGISLTLTGLFSIIYIVMLYINVFFVKN